MMISSGFSLNSSLKTIIIYTPGLVDKSKTRKIRRWSLKGASSVLERRRSAWIEARTRIFCGNREEPRGTHSLKYPKILLFGFFFFFLSPQWITSGYFGFKSLIFVGENETETRGLELDPPQISWRV